ncbi:MAG: DUF1015 domain-containing protein [Actinomycetes bacterium]
MPTPSASAPADRGLVVSPFRGVRFAAERVRDLAAVTSPPYDVVDAESAAHLEELDPHNVVRLILPRDDAGNGSGRYRHAADRLSSWLTDGTLRRDEQPAFYVYEQSTIGMLQRGLLAAVDLRDPEERVVLPHEDVMAGPVADRLELMRATAANLEPILLVYDGGGQAASVVDQVADGPPLVDATTEDGIRHRMWAIEDRDVQAQVAADLRPRQALIADGHHRYATYRRLQAENRTAGRGAGPWDRGLAMLVDSRTYPLHVQAIHRVVEGLDLDQAVALAARAFRTAPVVGGFERAQAALESAPGTHPYLVGNGRQFHLLSDPDPDQVAAALPGDHSALWQGLDASVLHALLLERLWDVPDGSPRTRYVHDADGAVRAAERSAGTAVLLRPVGVSQVLTVAASGERMPRKSTSFGPKPRTGLVLRLFED